MSTLPVETWLQVLSYVEKSDRPTLASLCKVSKTLHQLSMPLLYAVITSEDLKQQSLVDALNVGARAKNTAACVREISVNQCLRLERPDDARSNDAEGTALDQSWSQAEVNLAQSETEAAWQHLVNTIKNCTGIVKLSFTISCNDTRFYGPDGGAPIDLVPLPSTTSLLSLPFLDTLAELFIHSPQAPSIDYRSFGELIVRCSGLYNVRLHFVEARSLFLPISQAIALRPAQSIALQSIEWEEILDLDDGYDPIVWFDEILSRMAAVPSLRKISFLGTRIYHSIVEEENLQRTLRLPAITSLVLKEISPRSDEHHQSSDRSCCPLQTLATSFPALQLLTMTVIRIALYGRQNTTFPSLRALTLLDKYNFAGKATSFPMHLLSRSFAPELEVLKYQVQKAPGEIERLAEIEQQLSGCEMAGVGSKLASVEIQLGGLYRRFVRCEMGFKVVAEG